MEVISNLSGLVLCPFQCLIDISEQLPGRNNELKQTVLTAICELNTTNDWINLEALGNPVAIRGKMLCDLLAPILKNHAIHTLQLHVNIIGAKLTSDNLFALLYLANSLEKLDVYFYTKQEQIELLQETIAPLLKKTNVMVRIEQGQSFFDQPFLKIKIDQLELVRNNLLQTAGFKFSQSIIETDGINTARMGNLIGYAWACLKAGGYELGCLVLKYALSKSAQNSLVHEQLFMHLQLIRFLSHQYGVVTKEPFPDLFQYLDEKDINNLYFIKAYSATLSRDLAVAETYFKKSQIDPDMPMTDEASLYQLNLHALFLVLKGEIDSAYSLEIKIRDFIENNNIDTLGLKYVNFINIARIHKKLNQFDESLTYYRKAYSEIQSDGLTTSDHVYYNMNFGNVYEASGQTKKALFYWLKAAINWLSFSNQYALSWRPRLILCQEKITDILSPLPYEKANQFFLDKLKDLILKNGIILENTNPIALQFILDNAASIKNKICYIAENIILYHCETTTNTQIRTKNSSEHALISLVSTIVRSIMNISDDHVSIIIDSAHDDFYPQSDKECLALATLAGCESCYHNGKHLHPDKYNLNGLLKNIKLSLAKTISSIKSDHNGLQVRYKRSFLNKMLHDKKDISIIEQLYYNGRTELINIKSYSEEVILNLIRNKIIVAEYD